MWPSRQSHGLLGYTLAEARGAKRCRGQGVAWGGRRRRHAPERQEGERGGRQHQRSALQRPVRPCARGASGQGRLRPGPSDDARLRTHVDSARLASRGSAASGSAPGDHPHRDPARIRCPAALRGGLDGVRCGCHRSRSRAHGRTGGQSGVSGPDTVGSHRRRRDDLDPATSQRVRQGEPADGSRTADDLLAAGCALRLRVHIRGQLQHLLRGRPNANRRPSSTSASSLSRPRGTAI